MYYLILEICLLLAVYWFAFHVVLWKWTPLDSVQHLSLISISLFCGLLILFNLRYYASVIFNSPLLTLVCANSIIVLAMFVIMFGDCSLLRKCIIGMSLEFSPFTFPSSSCINFLILNVYMLIHGYDCSDSFFGKVSSGVMDYFFVSAVLTTAFYVSCLVISIHTDCSNSSVDTPVS